MSFITYRHIYALVSAILLIVSFCTGVTHATPALLPRDPYFPNDPPSCPICAQNYDGISSCAQAAPVLANASMILFNPGAFIDVIKCACTDSFQSAYPQCVDCFIQTNQTYLLDSDADSLPSVLKGLQQVCSFASVLFGGAATANGEATISSTGAASAPTGSSDSGTTNAAPELLSPGTVPAALVAGFLALVALL